MIKLIQREQGAIESRFFSLEFEGPRLRALYNIPNLGNVRFYFSHGDSHTFQTVAAFEKWCSDVGYSEYID